MEGQCYTIDSRDLGLVVVLTLIVLGFVVIWIYDKVRDLLDSRKNAKDKVESLRNTIDNLTKLRDRDLADAKELGDVIAELRKQNEELQRRLKDTETAHNKLDYKLKRIKNICDDGGLVYMGIDPAAPITKSTPFKLSKLSKEEVEKAVSMIKEVRDKYKIEGAKSLEMPNDVDYKHLPPPGVMFPYPSVLTGGMTSYRHTTTAELYGGKPLPVVHEQCDYDEMNTGT